MRYTKDTPISAGDWVWWRPFMLDGVEQERQPARVVNVLPMLQYAFHREARLKIYESGKASRLITVYLDSYRVEIIDDPEELAMISLGSIGSDHPWEEER